MRHKKAGNQLGRNPSHRRAMLRNMVTSLFRYSQIETTDAKAKAIRPLAEKMITLAKRGDLHARRQALAYMKDKSVVYRLFEEDKDRFKERQSGYVRIIKKGVRKGDGAHISVIQLISSEKAMGKTEKGEQTSPSQVKTAKQKVGAGKKSEKRKSEKGLKGVDSSKASGQTTKKGKKAKAITKEKGASSTKPAK